MEYLNLIFNGITTIAALYISFLALKHTAKPRIKIKPIIDGPIICDEETSLKFRIDNIGHWYAKPIVVDLVVYFNFPKDFKLIKILYGSNQEKENNNSNIGVGDMRYLKAKGIKLSYGEEGEDVHIILKTPENPGKYPLKIAAYSKNEVSYRKEYTLNCKNKNS